ncbi:MAG: hypothetical protein AAF587_18110 [Bacteroidota bacterium]
MNFISHFYLDRHLNDSSFFTGVSTPDLVSVFDRTIRLKARKMPLLMENEATPDEISFYQGVLRHFEGDRIFHTSTFFEEETGRINEILHDAFGDQVERGFFIAHILFELLLDKILIQHDSSLLTEFYHHLTARPVKEYVRLTEWVTRVPMPSYDGFLKKFIRKRYLYRYTDWEHVIYILKRIVMGVGIQKVEYLHSSTFLNEMLAYESELSMRSIPSMANLNDQLCKV